MNEPTKSFLRLSGELRNEIYGYLLCNNTWHLTDACEPYQTASHVPAGNASFLTQKKPIFQDLQAALALSLTCQKTYSEARLLPFVNATFCIGHGPTYDAFNSWLEDRTVEQRALITRIEVPIRFVQWQDREMEGVRPYALPVTVSSLDLTPMPLPWMQVSSFHLHFTMEFREKWYEPCETDIEEKTYAYEWMYAFMDMTRDEARRNGLRAEVTFSHSAIGNDW
jgi:hypothetical protein